MSKSNNKQLQRRGKKSITTIIIVILLIFACKGIYTEYRQINNYKSQIKELNKELQREKNRQEEVLKYKEYVNSREYKESVARTKLGLVYPDEVVLKPSENE